MKNWLSRIVVAATVVFVCSAPALTQRDALDSAAGDRYVISAKAGGVNFVAGTVAVARPAGRSGLLLKGDKLDIGDRVSTAADGKAEILLNPGSYLRLGPMSAFEFKTTALDDLQITLDSGSAIFEVFAAADFAVTVNTPKARFTLVESGIYRVDADESGRVSVWKGKARVGDDPALVKSGREAVMAGSQASVTKFNRGDKDELEIWSKERAKELAKTTGRLQRDNMRTALMRSFLGRQWNMYSSFGLWVYDPYSRSNCFLPFGWGWGSPYGYGFGQNIWYYNLPQTVFYPPVNTGNPGGPVRAVSTVKPGRAQDEPSRPPFAQIQGSSGATGRDIGVAKPGRTTDGGSVISPDSVRAAPTVSFPTSSGSDSLPAPVRVVQDAKPGRP